VPRVRNARRLGSAEAGLNPPEVEADGFQHPLVIRFIGADAARVRREASRRRVSSSRYVREMVRSAWLMTQASRGQRNC